MSASLVTCSQCKAILPGDSFNLPELFPCPSCAALLKVEAFPALFQTAVGTGAEPLLVEGESSCFYHPQKKAARVCDSCGRFMCGLCDLELNGQHVCPACLEGGQKKGKFKDLQNSRVRYDRLALTLAILPLVFVWTSIIGAPAALFVVLRYRKTPCGITGTSGLSFAIAGILAALEIIAWLVLLIYFINK